MRGGRDCWVCRKLNWRLLFGRAEGNRSVRYRWGGSAGVPTVVKNEGNRVNGRLTVRPAGTAEAASKSGERVLMEEGGMLARRPTSGLV